MVEKIFDGDDFPDVYRRAEMISPLTLLETCAERKIDVITSGIGIVGGCNGPHNNPESPLRNAAHWSITFSRLYRLTGKEIYHEAARRSFRVLQDNQALRAGQVPIMRFCGGDQANGVIGLAWLIEALVISSDVLQSGWGHDTARKLAKRPGFDWELGFWKTCEPDGQIRGIDPTPNHQLWFAMALSMLPNKDPATIDRLDRFVECFPNHIQLTPDRLIAHQPFDTGVRNLDRASKVVDILRKGPMSQIVRRTASLHPRLLKTYKFFHYVTEKEIGYHIFNLHAFARLNRSGIEFDNLSEFISLAVDSIFEEKYQNCLEKNKWGYPYNPPGFEVPIVLMTFARSDPRTIAAISYYYDMQIRLTYNPVSGRFDRNNPDQETLSARLYTLSLLEANEIQLLGNYQREEQESMF